VGCCEHGNEPSGYIKGGQVAERLLASQEAFCSVELFSYLADDLVSLFI
jgi:hypothetical protein